MSADPRSMHNNTRAVLCGTHQVTSMERCRNLQQSGEYAAMEEASTTAKEPVPEAQKHRLDQDCPSRELGSAVADDPVANQCSECNKCFRKRSHLLEHMRLHFPVPWLACATCGRHFTSASKLRTHRLREEGQARHACPHCSFRAVERHSLRRHRASVHGEVGDGNGGGLSEQPAAFVCSLCGLGFTLSPDLKAHWKAAHKRVVDGGGTGSGGKKMVAPFACTELKCGFVTRSRPEFARHVKTRHGRSAALCPHRSCHAIFSDGAAVQRHRRERHLPFHCTSCDFACSSKLQLQRHWRAGHAGPQRLACELCPFGSHNPVVLESHRARAHAGERLHRCAECSFSTPERRILNRHARTHSAEKPHKCPECEFACRDSSYLTRHMARHRDIREHMCSECGYLTKWKSALTMHMRKHSGDLRYRCDVCPYRCHRPDQLNSHKLRHGEKGLCCEICGYSCRRRAELRRHKQAKHSGCGAVLSPSSGTSVTMLTSPSSIAITMEDAASGPDGEGVARKTFRPNPPLQCRYCNYRTHYKQALLNHENCKHTHTRVFSCPTCIHDAFSASSLLNHRKKHHGYQPGTYAVSTVEPSQAVLSIHKGTASGNTALSNTESLIAAVWDNGDFAEDTAQDASETAVRPGVNDMERSALMALQPEDTDREHTCVVSSEELCSGSSSGMLVGSAVLNRDVNGVANMVAVQIDAVAHCMKQGLLQNNSTSKDLVQRLHCAAHASNVPHHSGRAVDKEMRDTTQDLVVPAVNVHGLGDAIVGKPVTADPEGEQHEGMSDEQLPVLAANEQELVQNVVSETYVGTLGNAAGVEETAAEMAKLLVSLNPTAYKSESFCGKLGHSQRVHDNALQVLESQDLSKESIDGDCTMLLETSNVQNTQYLQPFHRQSETVVCGTFLEERSSESVVDSRDKTTSLSLLAVTKVMERVDKIVPYVGKELTQMDVSLTSKHLPQDISPCIEEEENTKAGQPCDPVVLQKRRDRTCVGMLVEEGKVEVVVLCEARGAGRPVLRCKKCPFFTRSEKVLAGHVQVDCMNREEDGGSVRATKLAPHAFTCPECGAQFKQRCTLNTHQLKQKCPAIRTQCRAAAGLPLGVKGESIVKQVDLPKPQLGFITGTRKVKRDIDKSPKKGMHTVTGKSWGNVLKCTDPTYCNSAKSQQSIAAQPKRNGHPNRDRTSRCQKANDYKEGEAWVCEKGRFRCLHCPFLCRQHRAILSHGRKGCLRPGQILCGICSFVCQSNGALSKHRQLFHSRAKGDEMDSSLSVSLDENFTKRHNRGASKEERGSDSTLDVEATQGKKRAGEPGECKKDCANGSKLNKDISQLNTDLVPRTQIAEYGSWCLSNKHTSDNIVISSGSENINMIKMNAIQPSDTCSRGKTNVTHSDGEEIGQRTRSKTRAVLKQDIIKLEKHTDVVSGEDGNFNKASGEPASDAEAFTKSNNNNGENSGRRFGCERCIFRCKQERALETHLRRGCMVSGEVQCRLCSFVCKSPTVLRNHNRSHRRADYAISSRRAATTPSRLTRLKCKQCRFCCKQEGALQCHVDRHHCGMLPYRCTACKFITTRRYRLTAHTVAVHGVAGGGPPRRPHGCDQCSRSFFEATKLRSHQRRVHDRRPTHFCDRCDYGGYRAHDVARHVQKCHRNPAGKGPSNSFPCASCSVTFSSRSALRQHLLRKHRQDPLSKDGTPSPVAATVCLSPSGLESATILQCTAACGQKFSQHSDLREHQLAQHGPHRRHSHACPTCSKTFHGKQEMVLHILHKHEVADAEDRNNATVQRRDVADGKLLRCGLCNFSCRHQVVLEHHVRCHGGRKLYRCRLCTYSTRSGQKIAWHSRIHTGEKPYRCWLCEYTCTEPSRLQVHMRKHNADTKYLCPVCGYTCKWANQLKYHMTSHTGEKPYRCDKCEYATNRSDALRTHQTTRHQEGRTFVCEHCGKAFKTRYLLGSHMRKHAEDRPHVCPQCRRAFRWPAALRNHLLTHRFERPFACSLCTYQANQRAQVVSHLARRHTSEAEQGIVLDMRHMPSEMSALPLRNQSRRRTPATQGGTLESVIGPGAGDQSEQRRGGCEETRKSSSLEPVEPPSHWVTTGGDHVSVLEDGDGVGDEGGPRGMSVPKDGYVRAPASELGDSPSAGIVFTVPFLPVEPTFTGAQAFLH